MNRVKHAGFHISSSSTFLSHPLIVSYFSWSIRANNNIISAASKDISLALHRNPQYCEIIFGRARVLPWVDVIEMGKLEYYVSAAPWNSGYSLCTAPCSVATEGESREVIHLGVPFRTDLLPLKIMSGVTVAHQLLPTAESVYGSLDSLLGQLIHTSTIFSVRQSAIIYHH